MISKSVYQLIVYFCLTVLLITGCKKPSETTAEISTGDSTLVTTPHADTIIKQESTSMRIAFSFQDNQQIKELFEKIFPSDFVFELTDTTEDADIKITSWEFVYEGKLFTPSGDCKSYKIIETKKEATYLGKTYLEWYVISMNNQPVGEPLVVDITESQGEQKVDITFNEELAENCTVVSIDESYSGGDIDLDQYGYLTFYAANENGFSEIVTLVTEKKVIRNYFVDGGTPEVESNTREDFTIMSSVTNGLHDLQIITNELNEADETMNADGEICKWNGSRYECLPMMVD